MTLRDLRKMRIVTYNDEVMENLGDRHKQRIMIYKDIHKTMILDRKELEMPHERIFDEDLLTTNGPKVREIRDGDVVDVIEKLFQESNETKAAVVKVAPPEIKTPSKHKRKVELNPDTTQPTEAETEPKTPPGRRANEK